MADKRGLIADKDPSGLSAHEPGAKLDAGKNSVGLVLLGFPRALLAVSAVGTFGANKYTPYGWRSVAAGFQRYTDAMLRHLLAAARGERIDNDSKMLHEAQVAWNALARLELMLVAEEQEEALGRTDSNSSGNAGIQGGIRSSV